MRLGAGRGWSGLGDSRGPGPSRTAVTVAPNTLLFAGFYVRALAASAALRVPFLQQAFGGLGLVHATRHEAIALLEAGPKDESVGLNPGGIAEMFHVNDPDETIFLKHRKGFVKLAIQHGATLVPGYCFGSTKVCRVQVVSAPSAATRGGLSKSCASLVCVCLNVSVHQAMHIVTDSFGICRRISRATRMSLVLIAGRFGLPIAFRTPIAAAMGTPIVCERVANPSQEVTASVSGVCCLDCAQFHADANVLTRVSWCWTRGR